MKSKMYSIKDLTKILGLHPKTILRFIHEKKIKARKIGRSWMVHTEELKEYTHAELENSESSQRNVHYDTLNRRISVSAVIEINEQNSEEATRISNSLMAMLNCKDDSWGTTRFDFFYYSEIQKAKYVVYGTPQFIRVVMESFSTLCEQKEI